MKKLCAVLSIFITVFWLCGFAPKDPIYFTIHYHNQRVVVSDRALKPAWYNFESHKKFSEGKTIYQRAENAKDIKNDFPEIYQILRKIECEIERPAFSGNVQFDPSRKEKFWVVNAQNGIEMDVEAAAQEILATLKDRKQVDIIVKTKEIPHKPEKDVLSKIGLRGQYSTQFDAGNLSRSKNIERSVACFNGLIVMPGEELSFNRIVGPRTAARGYEEAKIIVDGEFVPGIGGGVCQTSTTLFNAALLSGLSIVESHNHSLPISYVPLGRDAMVSSAVDLVIQNNTGAPVYFETGIEKGNRVFVKVYGDKIGNLKYKPVTEVTTKPQEIEVVGQTPDNTDGYRKIIIENGMPARSVLTHLEIYKGNKLVNKKLVRKSNYKGKPEEVKYEKIPETVVKIEEIPPLV